MTRDRLEGLPMNALFELSQKENLDLDPGIDRDELIELLLEAYEEDQRERESLNNLIIKIEQSKFSHIADELNLLPPGSYYPSIPAHYDDNFVSILLRDPTWALAIWEIRKHDFDTLPHEYGFKGFALKVWERNEANSEGNIFFLIPLAQAMGSRYIHLPTQDRWYALELVAAFEKETRVLVQSRYVYAPLEVPPFVSDPNLLEPSQKRLMDYSGIHLCEPLRENEPVSSEVSRNDIPQRIGDWDESLFQETEK